MDRQTLCDWVHRYNAAGIAGVATGTRSGRPPALTDALMAELKELVINGPDPEQDGVVRWRCVDLRTKIADHFSVTVHKRSVAKLLCRLNLTRLQPRPYHPKKDAMAQETFKKTGLPLIVWVISTDHNTGSMQERTLRRRYSSSFSP
jgi:transposase